MPDFHQHDLVTTIHDLRAAGEDHDQLSRSEDLIRQSIRQSRIGLVLPVTAADMRAAPFERIVGELTHADYIDTIVAVLGVAPEQSDCDEAVRRIAPLGDRARVLWTDGPAVQSMYAEMNDAGIACGTPGKGRSVWTAFGYLLADPAIDTFVLHDCDIVDYDRVLLSRLCLPMVHPNLDFEFCKAYYARVTDRMHGRVVRLLVTPLVRALKQTYPGSRFVRFLSSFRYPLSGEFSLTRSLARSNRVASDWGLEVGTLAEVYRNTSLKRVCQTDLCRLYEHKHQELSVEKEETGLMRMAVDIIATVFRTLASQGVTISEASAVTLRASFLRTAQDCIRQYAADALVNNLQYDRHGEEVAAEAFAVCVTRAAEEFRSDPEGVEPIPNWTRVRAAFPDMMRRLRDA